MSVKVYTEIGQAGIAEGADRPGLMEYGYGQYVNAFVYDTELAVPEQGIDGSCGMYATERVAFDADAETISKARRRARDRARYRYLRDKENI